MLLIEWNNGTIEEIQADSVVAYDANPSIMIGFKDDDEVPVGFFNMNLIKSIKVNIDE